MRTTIYLLLLVAVIRCTAQTTLAESTFDTDTDGWSATPRQIRYDTNGFVWVREPSGDGDSTFFLAPSKYLGNKSGAYGGSLQFSMRDNRQGNFGNTTVILESRDRLTRHHAPYPTATWQDYDVPLLTNAWRTGSDPASRPPTEAELISILSDLTALRIRGEYSNSANNETNELDNVRLLAPLCISNTALRIYHDAATAAVRVEWPTNACGFVLHAASNVPTATWTRLGGFLPQASNGLFHVTFPTANPRLFFQLQHTNR